MSLPDRGKGLTPVTLLCRLLLRGLCRPYIGIVAPDLCIIAPTAALPPPPFYLNLGALCNPSHTPLPHKVYCTFDDYTHHTLL